MRGDITVIVNVRSGGAKDDPDARLAAIRDAFLASGLDVMLERAEGSTIERAAAAAASAGRILVAAGGDGTISTVASVAVRTGVTFGVLPLGTLNHFARDAGIPLALDKAAATIAAGHTTLLDVAEVNGRTFLNNTSLGLYPRLVWERQTEQRRGRPKWIAFAIALARTWQRYPTVVVRLVVDGVPLRRRTPFVFIGNGEYRAQGLRLGTRSSLDTGRLSVYVAPECGPLELLALPFRAVAGRLTPDAKLESFSAAAVEIETGRGKVRVAVDGELMLVDSPLACCIRPAALRTIVPGAA